MRTLSAPELLAAWDQGCLQRPIDRALAVLAVACDVSVESLTSARLGRRDALLLALRERTFGPWLDGLATCPLCSDELGVALAVGDLLSPDGGGAPDAETDPATEARFQHATAGGYQLTVRVPDGRDAVVGAAAAAAAGRECDIGLRLATTRRALLERCVSAWDAGGEPVPVLELPEAVVDTAVGLMAAADPQADLRLDVTCPSCGTGWEVPFDAGSFLWSEVEAWARRTLLEVHQLAAAYGWNEAEVLALGPRRRQAYLELIRG
jgi:hypothetical protein